MKTLILHHNKDLDGVLSGVIAKFYLDRRKGDNDIIITAGADYGDNLDTLYYDLGTPSLYLKDFDQIYVIDFSDDWLFNSEHQKKIIWIDHHASAIAKNYPVAKYTIDGVAACRLTQQFFANINYAFLDKYSYQERQVQEPLLVALLGEYDIWDESSVFAFQFNFGLAHNLSFGFVDMFYKEYKSILASDRSQDAKLIENCPRFSYVIEIGKAVIDSIQTTSKTLGGGVQIEINGVKGRAFNTHIRSSLIHRLQGPDKFIMVWNYTGSNRIKCSFYCNEGFDASVIACHFGGGGHVRACGCQMDIHTLTHLLTKPYNF